MSNDYTPADEMQDFNIDDLLGDSTSNKSIFTNTNSPTGDIGKHENTNMPKSPDFKSTKKGGYIKLDNNTPVITEDGETAELRVWRDKLKRGEKKTIHCPTPDHQDDNPSAFMELKENGNLFWCCASCGCKGWCNNDKASKNTGTTSGKNEEETPNTEDIVSDIIEEFYLFKDDKNDTYAEIEINGSKIIAPIMSSDFADIMRVKYFDKTSNHVNSNTLNNIIATTHARVRFGDNVEIVALRTHKFDDCVYINVGDKAGRVIMVDKHGYRYVTDSKVKFITTSRMEALPEIVFNKGNITLLTRHLNVTESEMPLVIGWLVTTLAGVNPYLHLTIRGVAGSSKSSTARTIQALIDPSKSFSGAIKSVHDFAAACANGYLIIQDNLSNVSRPLADAMCLASTGGTHEKRELYSNNGLSSTRYHNPIITTYIFNSKNNGDLDERSAIIEQPPIPKAERKDEGELRKAFNQDKSAIFTGLLDMIVSGFKHFDSIELDSKPRMADAAKWITACEQDSGMSGNFLKVFTENQAMESVDAFDESPACRALISFMESRERYKTPITKLLNELESHVSNNISYARGWPATRNALSAILDEFNDRFESIGIHIKKNKRRGTNTARNYIITNSNYKPANGLKSVTDNSSECISFFEFSDEENR